MELTIANVRYIPFLKLRLRGRIKWVKDQHHNKTPIEDLTFSFIYAPIHAAILVLEPTGLPRFYSGGYTFMYAWYHLLVLDVLFIFIYV